MKDRAGEGGALNNLGIAYANLGRHEKAIGYYEQALAIPREVKDRAGEGIALNNLGIAYKTWAATRRRSNTTSRRWRFRAR